VKKKIASIAAALLTAGGVMFAAGAPAAQAGTADPYASGCYTSDTWISPWYGSPDIVIRLFWSPECNAYWAEYQGNGFSAQVADQGGDVGYDIVNNDGGYTAMVGGNGWGQGCVYTDGEGWVCTPRLSH
jgi:hypothetical protein